MRLRRGLSDNAECPRCGFYTEDNEHIFRNCVVTKAIWSNVAGNPWLSADSQLGLSSWIKKNLKPRQLVDPFWNLLFIASLWQIWLDRNKKVFDHVDPILNQSLYLIHSYANQILQAFSMNVTSTSQITPLIKWSPHFSRKIKLNTDGCARGNLGDGGFGGAFRDEAGTWLFGFFDKLDNCSSLKAEM
ncbi:hypothetical protein ACSBR2_007560 [Camellia fascicularis]